MRQVDILHLFLVATAWRRGMKREKGHFTPHGATLRNFIPDSAGFF